MVSGGFSCNLDFLEPPSLKPEHILGKLPAVRLRPLNLLSASSVNLHGLANTSIFHNNLRVMLSPLKSPVLRKYSNPFKRPGMFPSISKCNAKRCNCCMHLCTNSTVTSSVNGRKFSVVNNSELD